MLSAADLARDPDHAAERVYVIVRIAVRAACDMLPITMATLSVTNTDKLDLVVWIRDLNSLGKEDGGRLNQNQTLFVQLEENEAGEVSYHWAAEQIVAKYPYHGVGVGQGSVDVDDAVDPPLNISLGAKGDGSAILPYMFRPYP